MAQPQRQPFTPKGPFVVSRPFRWAGRDYNVDEVFPARRMAVDPRRLRQLWEQRKLMIPLDGEVEEVSSSETLLGSNSLPAVITDAAGSEHRLGEIVQAAFEKSELTVDQWNELADDDREARLQSVVDELLSTDPVVGEGQFLFDPEIHTIDREGQEYWIADDENLLVRVRADMGKSLADATEKTVVPAEKILEWPEEDTPEPEQGGE